ncbi:MAG: hypothetical protein HC846_05050, partial [Blastocatellia bacterium]|nr:hypothetical protein [Blastocatellia bacterium]
MFLKIEAANLNGDIDIFYADNLRPLTKISIYADSSPTQTGREIYLRKQEKLILKVEGKSPNDDPATFSIKFEGSFLAMAANKEIRAAVIQQIKEQPANKGWQFIKNKIGYYMDTATNLFSSKGMIITFSGVDGAGKSTVIENTRQQIEKVLRKKVVVLRHRPSVLPILSAWKHGKEAAEKKQPLPCHVRVKIRAAFHHSYGLHIIILIISLASFTYRLNMFGVVMWYY